MPSSADALKGFFLAQMPDVNQNTLATAADLLPGWAIRWINNHTFIDANNILNFGLVKFSDIGGIAPSTLDANVGFSGVCGMFSNTSVNTFNVIADTLECSSILNAYQNVNIVGQPAGPQINFSINGLAPDLTVSREFPGALDVDGTTGGGVIASTGGIQGVIMLNDTGGVAFGAAQDAYLTRIGPGVLGISPTGYGDFSGNLQLSLLSANTLLVAGLTTLTGNVTFSGFINTASTLQVAGLTTLTGNVTFSGFINTASTLQVAGLTTLTGNVTASDDVQINSALSVGTGSAPSNVFEVKAQANAHITFGAGITVSTAACFTVLNDAYNLNELLEFRSSGTTFATGYINALSTLQVAGVTTFLSPPILPSGTVASFTSPVTGMLAFITDATSNPVFHGAITGGGVFITPACYNGISWICI